MGHNVIRTCVELSACCPERILYFLCCNINIHAEWAHGAAEQIRGSQCTTTARIWYASPTGRAPTGVVRRAESHHTGTSRRYLPCFYCCSGKEVVLLRLYISIHAVLLMVTYILYIPDKTDISLLITRHRSEMAPS